MKATEWLSLFKEQLYTPLKPLCLLGKMLGVYKKQPAIPYQRSANSGDETTIATRSVVKTGVIKGPDPAVPCAARGRGGGFPAGRMLWQPVVTKVKSGPLTSLPRTHLLTAHSWLRYMTTEGTIKPIPNDNPPWMCLHANVFTAVHNATAYRWKRTWPPDTARVPGCLKWGGKTFFEVGSCHFGCLLWTVLEVFFSFPDL